MAETGCLKDGHFQNLEVAGNTELGLQSLNIKGINGVNNPVILTLQTGETDISHGETIGQIDFQAPDVTAGDDAILVCAGIEAVSEGIFATNNNATKLSFKTGASEEAVEKMSLSSDGRLTLSSGQANFRGGTKSDGTAAVAVEGRQQTSLVQSFPPHATSSDPSTAVTITNILTGVIEITSGAADVPLPTAANIVAGLNNPKVGDCIFFSIINTNAGVLTVTINAGTTIIGSEFIPAPDGDGTAPSGSALFRLRIVDAATPSVAVDRIA